MADNNLLMPQDDQPSRADARRNRARLLETAQTLFDKQGVESVSMTAIANTAGVGKGTLYRHFANKADVCNALLDEDQRALQADVLARLREHADTPAENLRWFLERVLQFVLRHERLLQVETDAVGIGLEHPAHFWWRRTLVGLLQRLTPGADVRYRADTLYVMLDVRTVSFQRGQLGYDEDDILRGLHDVAAQFGA